MYPQQTGWQQPQMPIYAQPTGYPQQQQQQPGGFPRPPLPPQASQQQYSFLSAPPPSQLPSGLSPQQTGWQQQQQQQPTLRAQATGWGGAGAGGLVPQATGWQGQGGQQPLMPQATGWHDPRLQMMQSSFMPMNTSAPFAQSGTPIFQQPSLPAGNLQSSMNLLNQTPSVKTPKIPWALTKDERKNYDQIFRAWDKDGSGFISGEMAREVFGQSGLGQDDMAQIWTLADMDNRGKLNIQEFHVAMALIYRRLNGNDMPAVLPAELVPASSKDLDSNVDFLKSLLRNDTNVRSTSAEPSYAKTRSFNDGSPAGGVSAGDRKKDGTVYKHDEDRELGKTYKSSSRHLDRASVRTGAESASDELAHLKRELADTSSRLDGRLDERERRDEEDELLDEELDDLKRRVRRVKDDIDYVSSGRPTAQKDGERRKLERELLHLAHEKLPEVERRIAERDERKKRDEREGVRARDRRNDRYGRYDERDRGGDDDDRGYLRGSYDRDRSRDRYDSYASSRGGERERERPRSPPPAPAPPAHSLAAPSAPPAPPKPTASPAPVGQTREQRLADARARALQKLEDRKRALGLGSSEPDVPAVDASVSERLEREKKEAEAAGKRAEEERARKEEVRRARLEAEKGGPPVPAPPAPPANGAPAVASKAAPPPPKPRSILKTRAPAPPTPKAAAPAAAAAPPLPAAAPAPEADEEDPVERQLREREERLKKTAADRAARLAALEAQEEEERKAEEAFAARRSAKQASATSTPPAPKSPEPTALAVPAAAVAQAATSPAASLGSHNPFAKFSAAGGAGSPAAAPASTADAAKPNPFFKPPTPAFTPPPMAAPVAKAPVKKFVPTPADEDDWDVIEDKANESDSSDDYDTAKRRKAELAKALFGGIMPSASPAPSSSNPPSASATPAPVSASSPTTAAAPPKNPMLAALGGGSPTDAGSRGGLFAAIQGGARLKKAVTVDKSAPAVTGAVVGGDAAPPAHIGEVARAVSPPPAAPAPAEGASPAAEPASANPNRQSTDWYAGLAANAPSGASAATSLPAQAEEDEDAADEAAPREAQAPVNALEGVDTSVQLRVRTLFTYDGQRPEDLSFPENVMIEAHPASDPESPWYYGTLVKDRKAGWFPSSYVADVADVVQAKALYSYTGSSDQELPFVEGDVLTIVEHSDESWWKAVSDGIVFLVPAAYLELLDAPTAATTSGGPDLSSPSPAADASPAAEPSPDAKVERPAAPRSMSLVITSPPEDAASVAIPSPSPPAVPSPTTRARSGSSASSLREGRRAPPPVPNDSHRPSSYSTAGDAVDMSVTEEDSGASSSEDDVSAVPEEDDQEAQEQREAERLRVLEAAGLKITVDSTLPPRPPRRARGPPPAVRARRPQSMYLEGGLPPARPESSASGSSSLPPSPAADADASPRIEDAYDRYEAMMSAQAEAPLAPLPEAALPAPSPTSPTPTQSSFGSPSSPALGSTAREGRLSQMMAKIQATVAPLATPEPSKRLSIASIGAPARQNNASPAASTVTRASTPAAESTSWASLIADQGILDSLSDKERKRQEAMFEFIATEASYVRDLQLIVGMFYARLVKILDDKELVIIFKNVEDILVTSTFMLSELEERQKSSRLYLASIADILALHMQNVEIYLPYCSNQSTAARTLQSLREKNTSLSSTLVSMRSEPSLRGLDLSTYLLSPMQRITRYPLLLKQILHYTEPGEDHEKLEIAIREAETVLSKINEQIRARENYERLALLSQELWIGKGRLDLTSPTRAMGPRRLLREGKATLKGKGSKGALTVVLTNDILILIDSSRTLYQMPMPLNEISVAEYPSTSSFGFVLVPRYRGDRVVLKTPSAREAVEWVAAIERAITVERRARLDMS